MKKKKSQVLVAILWHMHQPCYKNPFTGHFELPWLRLHALKDYFGMAHLLAEFPDLRLTFNLVPSMLKQLQEYTAGDRDSFQEIFAKPAATLNPDEIRFLVRHFFSLNQENHVKPYPRFEALYQKKMSRLRQLPEPAWEKIFSSEELRDIQVWFPLSHIDECYRNDNRIRKLREKESKFSEADKNILAEVETELMGRIIPEYKSLLEQGQIEIATSPFYHPILPLLIDPQDGRRANPHLAPYELQFHWEQDAREQLRTALDFMGNTFGKRPVGIWPAEGGLSEAVLALIEELGVSWTAADEANLALSSGQAITRDANSQVQQPGQLYRPYRLRDAKVNIFFRDHYLSDLIGFYYQKRPAQEAANDLYQRLAALAEVPSEQDLVVPIILDGENAWEFYPGSGRDFLRHFYQLLLGDPRLRPVTFSEACSLACGRLEHYQSGSWINANFDIWIGDEEDRQAWRMLAQAREAMEGSPATADQKKIVSEYLYIAQGSDWFWWYGRENFTPDLETFDRLFRLNLQKMYHLLKLFTPERLIVPICDLSRTGKLVVSLPHDFIEPQIDGRVSDYFEWIDSGKIDINAYGGTMNLASPLARTIHFGFSREHLYLRIDTKKEAKTYFDSGFVLELIIKTTSQENKLRISAPDSVTLQRRPTGKRILVGIDKIIELRLPMAILPLSSGDTFHLQLEWFFNGAPFQTLPANAIVEIPVPTLQHYSAQWQV